MERVRKRVFGIIQIGNVEDLPSRTFDIFIIIAIMLNLIAMMLSTFDGLSSISPILDCIDTVTVLIFTVEYVLRFWTARELYPKASPFMARVRFFFSFYGLVDLLTILPFFLPLIFPYGAVAFRMLRVLRILRLFRIRSGYDAFNVIIDVLKRKRGQLLSSIAMVLILMVASSLCMYSLEHDAQPEAFANAFSGIWWSVSTLLTVGYGDIYPVTELGKIMAIIISFLGVGMVAIPTGIISAGFVELYSKENRAAEQGYLEEVIVDESHPWYARKIGDLNSDSQDTVTLVLRGDERIVPRNELQLRSGDHVVVYRTSRK